MTDLATELVDALVAEGVTTVFGIPGTHNLPLFAAIAARGLRVVVPRHEQGAAYAADAYARVSGRPGVVVTTTGPGALNAAAGMAQAWSDSSPVLLIAPGMPTGKPAEPTGMLHEMPDQAAALGACVDRSLVVRTAAQARRAVTGFASAARSGRPRPWYVEVPLDLLDTTVDPAVSEPFPAAGPADETPHADAGIATAAALLAAARRPVIVAGGGAHPAAGDVAALSAVLGAPVVTTVNGRGVVSETDAASLGATLHLPATQRLLASADAVLVVGSELAESDTWTGRLRLGGAIVRVDVDPVMASVNADPPAVALVGRSERLLPRLLAALPAGRSPVDPVSPDAVTALRSEAAAAAAPWSSLLAGLRTALPGGAVVVADNAKVAYHAAQTSLPVVRPGRYLFPAGFGTLGWAVPAAVGALVARPDRPVLALTGDGGLQFSVAELATLRDLRIGVPVVVLDNGGYGEIRDQMRARGDHPVAVDLAPPRWSHLAAAYGCGHVAVEAPSDRPECAPAVVTALAEAYAGDRPVLIVVDEAGAG